MKLIDVYNQFPEFTALDFAIEIYKAGDVEISEEEANEMIFLANQNTTNCGEISYQLLIYKIKKYI